MTEAEWLECRSLRPMAEHLGFPHASVRKRWLLACACCRRIWHTMADHRSRRVIEMRERHAFNQANEDELWQAIEAAGLAREDAKAVFRTATSNIDRKPEAASGWAAAAASSDSGTAIGFVLKTAGCRSPQGWKVGVEQEQAAVCELLREIFGNPFCPVAIDLCWLTSTVVSLARETCMSGDFAPMPILADALQDAGCENTEILDHCRSDKPHVLGCFVVDALLGKS